MARRQPGGQQFELPQDVRVILGYLRCNTIEKKRQYLKEHRPQRMMLVPRKDEERQLLGTLEKLTGGPEHATMWRAIEERAVGHDVLWVYGFLQAVQTAANLPRYFYESSADRRDLVKRIQTATRVLVRLYTLNELAVNLVKLDGKFFNGFHIFEDFSDSNRAVMEADGVKKLPIALVLEQLAKRAEEHISSAETGDKASRSQRAVRFVRSLAERNRRQYDGLALNAVIETACNSLFGTRYSESDISRLLSRAPTRKRAHNVLPV